MSASGWGSIVSQTSYVITSGGSTEGVRTTHLSSSVIYSTDLTKPHTTTSAYDALIGLTTKYKQRKEPGIDEKQTVEPTTVQVKYKYTEAAVNPVSTKGLHVKHRCATSPWSRCSVTCGTGWHMRVKICAGLTKHIKKHLTYLIFNNYSSKDYKTTHFTLNMLS